MEQHLLDAIDPFIDAQSPQEIPQEPQMRQQLFGILVNKVTEDWNSYLNFHQDTLDNFPEKADIAQFKAASRQLQELCARLVFELEEADKQAYSQEALFSAKSTFMTLRFQIDSLKEALTTLND